MKTIIFPNQQTFSKDVYVGDYKEYAKTHHQYDGKGVVFSDNPLPDLKSLYICNPNDVVVSTVNFQDYDKIFRNIDGDMERQCEGMCYTCGWTLLIELKYCLEKNISRKFNFGVKQLENTLSYLRNTIHAIEEGEKTYWVISFPDYSCMAPFHSFAFTPDKLLALNEKFGVTTFFKCNELEIDSETNLRRKVT